MTNLDPVATAIGLEGYATESNGIGGVLKARVTDFRVDEISTTVSLDPRGRFTVARITLINWETNKFCNNLAKRLGYQETEFSLQELRIRGLLHSKFSLLMQHNIRLQN